jgi:Ca2+-binding EF-hand superfamily protein
MNMVGFATSPRHSDRNDRTVSRGADESKLSSGMKISTQLRDDTDAIVDTIRRKLMDYLGPGSGSARKIKEAFEDMDANRSGTIDKREFEKALTVLRVEVSPADLRILFDRFDPDRNGLNYVEFLELLDFHATGKVETRVSAKLQEESDAVVATIRRKLESYLGPGAGCVRKMKEAFADMDANRSGTIDKREFEKAMSVLKVNVSARDVSLLFERFDMDRNGLNYLEFIELIGFQASPRKLRF